MHADELGDSIHSYSDHCPLGRGKPKPASRVDTIHSRDLSSGLHALRGHFGNVPNGWSSTAAYPCVGDDFWFRATANFGGIWWNSSNEAVYEMLHIDVDGATTTGNTTYTDALRPGRQMPTRVVDGFWSLTVYGKPDYMLVANPAERYNVSTGPTWRTGDDGSLTIDLRPTLPAGTP